MLPPNDYANDKYCYVIAISSLLRAKSNVDQFNVAEFFLIKIFVKKKNGINVELGHCLHAPT